MGVSRRRLDLPVAQQTPDHGKGLAQGQGAADVRVAQVMDPHAIEARARADGPPGLVDVPKVRARLPARYDPRVAGRGGAKDPRGVGDRVIATVILDRVQH